MKYFIKLMLVFILSVQSLMAYAFDGPEDIDGGGVLYPPVNMPNIPSLPPKICDSCIPIDAVVGNTITLNGDIWKLSSQLQNGDWILSFVGRGFLMYQGRSADETFGTTEHSLLNNEAIRWMNVGYSVIDGAMDTFKPEFRVKIKTQIYKSTSSESAAVIKKVKENLKTKSGNENSFICPDFECSSVLQSFATKVNPLQPIQTNQTADEFMGDLYNNLSASEPFAADQVGQSGKYIDTKPYLSSHQEELNKERDRLNDSRAQGPQQWDAKVAAYLNLRKADNAYLANDNQAGDDHFKVAHFLADVATDIIPFTAIPKDIFKALVGKDPLTGQDLSPMERVLAAGFAGLNTFSLGGAGVLAAGIKNVGRAAGATLKEIALAEKLTEVIAKSPLRVEVLVKGASEEFTLIGRDMTRVNEVSAALEKNGIKVNTLTEFTEAANKQWEKLLTTYKAQGLRIPDVEVVKSLKYVENETWIKSALEKGHTILDLGDPAGNVFSPFYNMEKKEILNYLRKVK